MQITYAAIQRAWDIKDPGLVDYIVRLAEQGRPEPDEPVRDDALTFDRFLQHICSPAFRKQPPETQRAWRQEQLALLEADGAEVPLPESLRLYRIFLLLWSDENYYARRTLIAAIRAVPLVYGPWKALKHIYKAAEAQHDYELLGEIAARLDSAGKQSEISTPTLVYMVRRSWRYLRKLGESIPVCYPEAAIHYLAAYPDDTRWQDTWVANHIFHHNSKQYGRNHFSPIKTAKGHWLKNRAFAETWKRSPAPLLQLIQRARSEQMRLYAADALQHDFAIPLRNIDATTLQALMAVDTPSQAIDNFIVWLLKQASRFEQHQYRELGLHEGVLALLDSTSREACRYACDYVRAHALDLPLDKTLSLVMSEQETLRKLGQQLISARDPRKDIGLPAWGALLESHYSYAFASAALLKHFGRRELTSDWFRNRLLAATHYSVQFATGHLLELHPLKKLGTAYFTTLLLQLDERREAAWQVADFALEQIEQLGVEKLDSEWLETFLLHPLTGDTVRRWIFQDDIKLSSLPIGYCKALAYEPDWKQSPLIRQLQNSDQHWAQNLEFDQGLAQTMREWLADVRRIQPLELGFEWLMQLVNSEESTYHAFATERMIKAYLPADFAPQDAEPAAETTASASGEVNVDLDGQTFLFTGKLMTMTRSEAQKKVTAANGKNSAGVNGKLNYLVIGDDGSPLYGNGRKGSKQVKAESLNAGGAAIKIISETAFLQMLAGEAREFSTDQVIAGCETLWAMLLDKPDKPVGKFARQYIRYHHPAICLQKTDRPVDPGAEIPAEFLTFQRFEPLFQHELLAIRKFALEFAHWEFARWQPESAGLIRLCESKHKEVREFVTQALLEAPDADNEHYRIDAGRLEAAAVYSFCESKDPATRRLGMEVIRQHEPFQQPQALFQLTESPDRELRAFVIRVLWSQYRRYSTTRHWQPRLPEMAAMGRQKQEARAIAEQNRGDGLPPRPESWPATPQALQELLRRWLYELPPGRLSQERMNRRLKPLSASAAKKALIETWRDLALEDAEFARLVLPLFQNFTRSRSKMEQSACLVAVTRIRAAHPATFSGEAA